MQQFGILRTSITSLFKRILGIDKCHYLFYNIIIMNDYELSKLADLLDEDALRPDEIPERYDAKKNDPKSFKEKYLEFYDDIKTTPHDDW